MTLDVTADEHGRILVWRPGEPHPRLTLELFEAQELVGHLMSAIEDKEWGTW